MRRLLLAALLALMPAIARADGAAPQLDFTVAGGLSHVIASGYGSNVLVYVNEFILGPYYGAGAIRLHVLGAGVREVQGFGLSMPYVTLVAHERWKFVPKGFSVGLGKLPGWPTGGGRKGYYSFIGFAK